MPFARGRRGGKAPPNVLGGERYVRIHDEVKRCAPGCYGKLPATVAPETLDRIVENGSPTIAPTPPEPEPILDTSKLRYPDAGADDLLLRHPFPAHVLDDRTPEPPRRPLGVLDETGGLVGALGACEHIVGQVPIRRGWLRLDLRW